MALTRLGITYNVGLDQDSLNRTVVALTAVGDYDLAKNFLMASGMSDEQANGRITQQIETFQNAQRQRQEVADKKKEPETKSESKYVNTIPAEERAEAVEPK